MLGTVYENAAFPFTKQIIDGVEYWSFDSADSSLALKYDSGESRYFFQNMGLQDWSRNTESGGTWSEGYGFFPFNAVIGSSANASKYNFGFGLKMDIKFFLPEDGRPVVNELNTMPGFTSISLYPRMWAHAGLAYPDLLTTLIETALARGTGLR